MIFNENKSNDLNYMLQMVAIDGLYLRNASKNLQNNKELVIAAITLNPEAFNYCSSYLKDNYNIFMLAFNKLPSVFNIAGESIRNNKKIALKALEYNFDHCIKKIGKKLINEAKNKDIDVATYYRNLLLYSQLQNNISNTYTTKKNKL